MVTRIDEGLQQQGLSRPEELHLRPLTERCVNLSIHTAPIKHTYLSHDR
jgi:hypothetical protein